MMSVESSGQVNLAKTYKPTFEWSQIDPGAGELTIIDDGFLSSTDTVIR